MSEEPQEPFLDWPLDWQRNFGQSPQCRSYAQAYSKAQYTFTDCGSGNTVISGQGEQLYPLQIPPALVRRFSPEYTDTCCGNCSLDIPELRLYYFPDKPTIDCNFDQTSNFTSASSAANLRKRIQSLIGTGSIAIVSGHILYVKCLKS